LPAGVVVLDLHGDDSADAREAVDHDADQRPIAQADEAYNAALEKLSFYALISIAYTELSVNQHRTGTPRRFCIGAWYRT
jgi:hypothetical protein